MKFSQLSAFEKHLKQTDPSHLSDLYFIVDPEPYMQRKLAIKLLQKGEHQEFITMETLSLGKLKEALETLSLFHPRKCCFLLGVEKLSKPILDYLINYAQNPHPGVRLVLSASQMTPSFNKLVKHGIGLDLSTEKPWDKERRLALYVQEGFKKAKLYISPPLSEEMVRICGVQIATLDQEIEKLICYLYGKKEVQREDLSFLQNNTQLSIFKVGEALLEGQVKKALQIAHHALFPTPLLIYSLRTLFQRSLRMKELSKAEAASAFPMLKGRLLDKNLQLVSAYPKKALKKALLTLFSIEVKMKNQKIPEELLQSLLLLKLGAPHEPSAV